MKIQVPFKTSYLSNSNKPCATKSAPNKRKRKGRKSKMLSVSRCILRKEICETAAEDGKEKTKYKPTVVRRNLVDKLLYPYLTSCVPYVEKDVRVYWKKSWYRVTGIRNNGLKVTQLTNQVSLHKSALLIKKL